MSPGNRACVVVGAFGGVVAAALMQIRSYVPDLPWPALAFALVFVPAFLDACLREWRGNKLSS